MVKVVIVGTDSGMRLWWHDGEDRGGGYLYSFENAGVFCLPKHYFCPLKRGALKRGARGCVLYTEFSNMCLLRNHQSAEMGFWKKCVDIGALGGLGGEAPPEYSAAGDFLGEE